MRLEADVYWSTSLPKDHDALHALDAFCQEWGGLTRTEATRRILIEWDKLRRGKDVSAWGGQMPERMAMPVSPDRSRHTPGRTLNAPFSKSVAQVASQVLDD